MNKVIPIILTGTLFVTICGFWFFGAGGMAGLVYQLTTIKEELRRDLWSAFKPGWQVRDGTADFFGFWGFSVGSKIKVWTVSSFKSYSINSDTKYFYSDACSSQAIQKRILYGSSNVDYMPLSWQEWVKLVKPGDIVEVVENPDTGMVNSLYLSSANFYNKFMGKEITEWCR